jgi:hypothetical protein
LSFIAGSHDGRQATLLPVAAFAATDPSADAPATTSAAATTISKRHRRRTRPSKRVHTRTVINRIGGRRRSWSHRRRAGSAAAGSTVPRRI